MQMIYPNKTLFYCVIGSFSALGFEPFGIYPIFIISFALLFVHISTAHQPIKRVLWHSFVFFLFMHIANLYWLIYPLTIDLQKHFWLIPLAITIVPLYFSVLLTISVLITFIFNGVYAKALIFSTVFCILTYIYGHFSLGFPWVMPAYIWNCHEVFMQTASVYGIYGLGLVTILTSCALGIAIIYCKRRSYQNVLVVFGIFILINIIILVFGVIRLSNNKQITTSQCAKIVQCNIKQKNNKTPSFDKLTQHLFLSNKENKVDFVIWSEASIPYLYREDYKELNAILSSSLATGSYLISGAVREDITTGKIYNSIIFIDYIGNNIGSYDKKRLVPFGEYIPCRKLIPKTWRSIANDINDFNVGGEQHPITINGLKIYPVICYEAIFPENFISIYTNADLIINITNDAWFGFTSEPFQHMHIARMRSIETGLPLIRATNYGISAIYDGCGRLIANIPIEKSGSVSSRIPAKLNEQPIYNKYGDAIFWIICGICILLAIILSKYKIGCA